jgi:hypothetical protein
MGSVKLMFIVVMFVVIVVPSLQDGNKGISQM